jgi:hypothetical protein
MEERQFNHEPNPERRQWFAELEAWFQSEQIPYEIDMDWEYSPYIRLKTELGGTAVEIRLGWNLRWQGLRGWIEGSAQPLDELKVEILNLSSGKKQAWYEQARDSRLRAIKHWNRIRNLRDNKRSVNDG